MSDDEKPSVDTSDEQCALVCVIVSNLGNQDRRPGWQRRVSDLIRALRDERNALRSPPGTVAPEGWRPISTAPKDGTHVLALWPSKRRQAAFDTYWDSDQSQGDKPGWYAPGWGYLLDGYEPTGWMPHPAAAPSPPASEGK